MPDRGLWILGGFAALSVAAFLGVGLRGNIAFVLELRAVRLVGLVEVAVAVAVATVLLQTVTGNRILTPAILGLDQLYALGKTALVFALGGVGFASLDPRLLFAGSAVAMALLAAVVFAPLLAARLPLVTLLLTGAVLGILFRSLTLLLTRVIDPNDFAVLQGQRYANAAGIEAALLLPAGATVAAAAALAWRWRRRLDVMALGMETATGLGVDWRSSVRAVLGLVVLLTAVSTALIGPVAFLGLLVVALALRAVGTERHAILIPAAVLTAVTVLVGGQTVLQHGLGGAATLGVVVEFAGGMVFLALLARGIAR